MAGRGYWTEQEFDNGRRDSPNYRYGYGDRANRSYGGFQGENNRSYSQSRNSSNVQQSIPQPEPAGTVCTLCRETLFTNYDVQAHLASPRHLDMVVRYPMIPLQDVLVPAHQSESPERFNTENKSEGKVILEELESSLGSEAVSNILMSAAAGLSSSGLSHEYLQEGSGQHDNSMYSGTTIQSGLMDERMEMKAGNLERREVNLREELAKLRGERVVEDRDAWELDQAKGWEGPSLSQQARRWEGQHSVEQTERWVGPNSSDQTERWEGLSYRDDWTQPKSADNSSVGYQVQPFRSNQEKERRDTEAQNKNDQFGEALLQALRESDRGRKILEEELRKEFGRRGMQNQQSSGLQEAAQLRAEEERRIEDMRRIEEAQRREQEWEERRREEKQIEEERRKEESRRREERRREEERRVREERRREEARKKEEARQKEEERREMERRKAEEEERHRAEEEKRRKEEEKRREEERKAEEQRLEEERKRKELEAEFEAMKEAEKQEAAKIAELFTQLEELKTSRLARSTKRKEEEEKLQKMRQGHMEKLAAEEEALAKWRQELDAEQEKRDAEFDAKQEEVAMQWDELLKDAKEFEEMDMQEGGQELPFSQFTHEDKTQAQLPFSQFSQENVMDADPVQQNMPDVALPPSANAKNSSEFSQPEVTNTSQLLQEKNSTQFSDTVASAPSSQPRTEAKKSQKTKPSKGSPIILSTDEDKESKITKRIIRVKKRVVKKPDEESPIAKPPQDADQLPSDAGKVTEAWPEHKKEAASVEQGSSIMPAGFASKIDVIAASLSEFAKTVKEKRQQLQPQARPISEGPEHEETDFYIDTSGAGDPFVEEGLEASRRLEAMAGKRGGKQVNIPGLGMTDSWDTSRKRSGSDSLVSPNQTKSKHEESESGTESSQKHAQGDRGLQGQGNTLQIQQRGASRGGRRGRGRGGQPSDRNQYNTPPKWTSNQFQRGVSRGRKQTFGRGYHNQGGMNQETWYSPGGGDDSSLSRTSDGGGGGNYLESRW